MRRTWAPGGQTPVLRHRYRRGKQLSMCGLVAYRPGQGNRDEPATWMGFDLLEAPTTPPVRPGAGGPGLPARRPADHVIWDNLGAHAARALQQ